VFCNRKSLFAGFNRAWAGDNPQIAIAKAAVTAGEPYDRIFFLGITAYQLIRLADLYDFLHAGHLIQRALLHGPLVAGNANGRALRPGNGVRPITK